MLRLFKGLILLVCMSFSISAFAWVEVTATKSDTIESLAEKYRPQGISEMDMMIAIRHANPQLISKGFKSGMTLHVPTTTSQVRQAITGERQPGAKEKPTATAKAQSVEKLEAIPAAKPTKPAKQIQTQHKKVKAKPQVKPVAKSTKPAPKPVKPALKPVPAAKIVPVVAPVNNLQQTIDNQAQTIQNYQDQVADLTQQLSAAKQANSSGLNGIGVFSFANIWFALWVVTFFLFLMSRQKNRKLTAKSDKSKVFSTHATTEERQPKEPRIVAVEADVQNSNERVEPSLHDLDEQEWRQVELDIPATGAPAQTNIRLEPSFSFEEQQELVG